MEIEKLHEKLQRYNLPSYTPFNHIHTDDCILEHMEESHEMHLVFHVLENSGDKPDQNQVFVPEIVSRPQRNKPTKSEIFNQRKLGFRVFERFFWL